MRDTPCKLRVRLVGGNKDTKKSYHTQLKSSTHRRVQRTHTSIRTIAELSKKKFRKKPVHRIVAIGGWNIKRLLAMSTKKVAERKEAEGREAELAAIRARREKTQAEAREALIHRRIAHDQYVQATAGVYLFNQRAKIRALAAVEDPKRTILPPTFDDPPKLDPFRKTLQKSNYKYTLPTWMTGTPYPTEDWRDKAYKSARATPTTTEQKEIHHYNFYGSPVYEKSSTPPEVSLWATRTKGALAKYKKYVLGHGGEWRRQTILIQEACKYIDPYTFEGMKQDDIDVKNPNLYNVLKAKVKRCYDYAGTWVDDAWVGEEEPHRMEGAETFFGEMNVDDDLPIIFDLRVKEKVEEKVEIPDPGGSQSAMGMYGGPVLRFDYDGDGDCNKPWNEIVAEAEEDPDMDFLEFTTPWDEIIKEDEEDEEKEAIEDDFIEKTSMLLTSAGKALPYIDF